MKRITKLFISAMQAAVIAANCVFTAAAASPQLDAPTLKMDEVTVSGRLPDNYEGRNVTLQVIKPGGSFGDYESIWYIREFEADADGSFEHTFKMKDTDFNGVNSTGTYTVYAGAEGLEPSRLTPDPDGEGYIESFYYITKKDRKTKCVDVIEAASTVEELAALLQDEEVSLILGRIGILQDEYEKLGEAQKESVLKTLLGAELNDEEALYKIFNEAVILSILNDTSMTTETIYEKMRDFEEYTGINYDDYDAASAEDKKFLYSVLDLAKGSEWLCVDDYMAALDEAWKLLEINSVSSYKDIWTVIEKYSEELDLNENDLNYYKSLTKEADIFRISKALTGKGFKKLSEVSDAFSEAVKELKKSKEEGTDNTGGGGGGNGGSGSRNNGLADPAITAPITPAEQAVKEEFEMFGDVPASHWAYDSIASLKQKGILNGDENGDFNPEEKLTREVFVTMLVLGIGLKDVESEQRFEDVAEGDWYYQYVMSAAKAQIVKGVEKDLFGVGMEISRQDMSVMIYRAAKYLGADLPPEDTDNAFSDDADIAIYAREAVYSLKNLGVINGMGDGEFLPFGVSTKAQAAVLIDNILGLI